MTTAAVPQDVDNDPDLLRLLIDGLATADPIYRPTAYWAGITRGLEQYLLTSGLARFRANRGVFSRFGASDSAYWEIPEHVVSWGWADDETKRAIGKALNLLLRHPQRRVMPFGVSVVDLLDVAFQACRMYGQIRGARSIESVSVSLAGFPESEFRKGGQTYTLGFLNAYWRYAHAAGLVDFSSVKSFVELGSGSGKQIEVIRKLHPDLACYALDLPAPLYVCGQYLKKALPGAIVDYRETRGRRDIRVAPGQAAILGNWQIEDIAPEPPVLFWSAASLGEMSPPVVANYLGKASRFSTWIYLMQTVSPKRGNEEATTFDDYERLLAPGFTLVDRASARQPLGAFTQAADAYDEAVWRRRD